MTDRLALREYRSSDASSLFKLLGNAEVKNVWNGDLPTSVEQTEQWLTDQIEQLNKSNSNGLLDFVVVLKESGEVIGVAGIDSPLSDGGCQQLQVLIQPELEGRGFEREILDALLQHYFEAVGVFKLVVTITRFVEALEHCGFKESLHNDKGDEKGNRVTWELFRADWLERVQSPFVRTRALHSKRIILRRYAEEDTAAFHRNLSDPRVMKYWSTPPHTELAQTERWMGIVFTPGPNNVNGILDFVIYHKATNKVIGKLGLYQPLQADQSGEIGYLLDPEYWGQGLMKEAMVLWLEYAFFEAGAKRLIADVDPRNDASLGLLKSVGFVETKREERTLLVGEEWVDSVYLELKKEDYRK
ncbi:hypothetical protein HDU79_004986 [Rhizoclosmatium sp. JEL0117]|nr:hypothetical protein HDU79_004986 [Rhizoclosmatium sp. JEL0117]